MATRSRAGHPCPPRGRQSRGCRNICAQTVTSACVGRSGSRRSATLFCMRTSDSAAPITGRAKKCSGPKPTDGHETAHSCGNRWCVNVRHLRWATQLENGDDKAVQCVHARGEQHPYAKLREAEVLTIYSLRGRASARGLAREYGVGTSAIASIWDGRSWSWLTGAPRVPHSHGKPLYSAARPHGPPKHGKRSGSSRLMSSTQQTT
jgi:hypothetical protein